MSWLFISVGTGHEFQFRVGHRQCAAVAYSKDLKRYAKGEIDKEEFERKKNDLKS